LKSRTRREKTKSNKSRNLSFAFATIAILISISLVLFIPVVSTTQAAGSLQMGNVDIAVTMETTASVSTDTDSYYYVSGQKMNEIFISFNVVANGDYVDWSTLQINPILYVEACGELTIIKTFGSIGSDLSTTDGGYEGGDFHTLDSLGVYLTTPDEVIDETEIYYLEIYLEVSAGITDNAGNSLTDESSFRATWQIKSEPLSTEETPPDLISPSFTTTPNSLYNNNEGISLNLEWVGVDDNPLSYEISTYSIYDGYRIRSSGVWTSAATLQYDADLFRSVEPGDYTVSVACKIIDADGQTAISSTSVKVTVPTTALITFEKMTTAPTTANAGPSSLELVFKPRSDIPLSYQVFQNGVMLKEGSWSGGDIIISVSYIYPGANDFRCVVFDTNGYSKTYIHTITASTDPYREIPVMPTDKIILNSPFAGENILSSSLWVAVAVFSFASIVSAVRWWREE